MIKVYALMNHMGIHENLNMLWCIGVEVLWCSKTSEVRHAFICTCIWLRYGMWTWNMFMFLKFLILSNNSLIMSCLFAALDVIIWNMHVKCMLGLIWVAHDRCMLGFWDDWCQGFEMIDVMLIARCMLVCVCVCACVCV